MAAQNSLFELEDVPSVDEQSREVQILQTTCRKRKPNFSAQEISIITHMKVEFAVSPVFLPYPKTNTPSHTRTLYNEL